MKAIINGTRFDTEKAIELGTTDNLGEGATSTDDFHYWTATLYKTPRSGRYFIAGEGGARSMWAERTGQGSWSCGSGIKPFESEEAAFEWAQQEFSWAPEWIEKHFGHLIEDA